MDKVKIQVAKRVSDMVRDTNWNQVVQPVNDKVSISSPISTLATMVTIQTCVGPRFFEVRVKEKF